MPDAEDSQIDVKDLQLEIEDLKNKLAEMEENWKRALADYQNLQKRTVVEKEISARFANYVLIAGLINVYDSIEMMLQHTEDVGFKIIADQFWGVLNSAGLEKVHADGEDFDADLMEAIETKEGFAGKVLEVAQNGYKFKNRLVRPARVIVGQENGASSKKAQDHDKKHDHGQDKD